MIIWYYMVYGDTFSTRAWPLYLQQELSLRIGNSFMSTKDWSKYYFWQYSKWRHTVRACRHELRKLCVPVQNHTATFRGTESCSHGWNTQCYTKRNESCSFKKPHLWFLNSCSQGCKLKASLPADHKSSSPSTLTSTVELINVCVLINDKWKISEKLQREYSQELLYKHAAIHPVNSLDSDFPYT